MERHEIISLMEMLPFNPNDEIGEIPNPSKRCWTKIAKGIKIAMKLIEHDRTPSIDALLIANWQHQICSDN